MPLKRPHNKKNTSKSLASKARFSKTGLAVFILVFGAIGGYILWRSFAAPAPPTIYLAPATRVDGTLSTYSIQVRENSGTTTTNGAQVYLTYPANLVDFVSVDGTGSAFSTATVVCPSSDPRCSAVPAGTIAFTRATCGGCAVLTGDQLVATINFKTKTVGGAATLAFATGTMLADSTTDQNILPSLASTAGGTYTIDTTPPSVTISSPANNSTIAGGGVVNITGTDSDAASSVSKVEIYIDGTLSGTLTSPSSSYSYPWSTAGVSLASHTIVAKAYDQFNNVASSSTTTVTLADRSAPSVPGSFRASSSGLNNISLAWNASTDNVGVVSYKISRGGSLIATIASPTLTYNNTGLAAGTAYSYSIQAYDAAGNASTAATLNASTLALKPGDLNADGHVDGGDLSIMLNNYLTNNPVADINGDGKVDLLDLSRLLSNYGT